MMSRKILKHLLITFLLSVLLTWIIYAVMINRIEQRNAYGSSQLILLMIVGAIVYNLLFALASLPALLLARETVYGHFYTRFLLYFGGSALVWVFECMTTTGNGDQPFFLAAGIVFFSIHTWFYVKLIRWHASLNP